MLKLVLLGKGIARIWSNDKSYYYILAFILYNAQNKQVFSVIFLGRLVHGYTKRIGTPVYQIA